MKHRKFRRIIPAMLAFVALTIAGLWSWNIVVELFDGPNAEYRHIVAIFVIAALLRAVLVTGRRHLSQETRQLRRDLKSLP